MAGKRHTIGKVRGVQVVWLVLACLLCTLWGGAIGGLIGGRISMASDFRNDYMDCVSVNAKYITASESIKLMDGHGHVAAFLFVDGEGLATLSLHDTHDDDAVMWLDSDSISFQQSPSSVQWWPKTGGRR